MRNSILLINANSLSIPLRDDSVSMVACSPPYFSLRDYKVADQIGMEDTPDCLGWATGEPCGVCFVCALVRVFREVKRVLHPTGTTWINLGDSYAGGGRIDPYRRTTSGKMMPPQGRAPATPGIKAKNLIGIPWRVALALQADGWYLRRDIIWHRMNQMPESVMDRPTGAHEYVFMLTKKPIYFYDYDGVLEKGAMGKPRALRSVWNINTQPYPGFHFACWPEALVERMIRASTSEAGNCSRCGAPWERVRELIDSRHWTERRESTGKKWALSNVSEHALRNDGGGGFASAWKATGEWTPGCNCPAGDPVPPIVLDPFCGSGTTLTASRNLGRHGVGIDLSYEYLIKEAAERTGLGALKRFYSGIPSTSQDDVSDLPLFAKKEQL